MAIKVTNLSSTKIIGFGETAILPEETKEIPASYENNPILETYKDLGFIKIEGTKTKAKTKADAETAENAVDVKEAAAEELRKARLASLSTISDEALAALATELGIRPETCKDTADMKKKVRAALKK
jgi:hypothetical protein